MSVPPAPPAPRRQNYQHLSKNAPKHLKAVPYAVNIMNSIEASQMDYFTKYTKRKISCKYYAYRVTLSKALEITILKYANLIQIKFQHRRKSAKNR